MTPTQALSTPSWVWERPPWRPLVAYFATRTTLLVAQFLTLPTWNTRRRKGGSRVITRPTRPILLCRLVCWLLTGILTIPLAAKPCLLRWYRLQNPPCTTATVSVPRPLLVRTPRCTLYSSSTILRMRLLVPLLSLANSNVHVPKPSCTGRTTRPNLLASTIPISHRCTKPKNWILQKRPPLKNVPPP